MPPEQAPDPADQATTPQPPQPKEKRPRRALTLDEREELARQQAARAAQALAKVRAARKKRDLHIKAAIGEVTLACMEKRKSAAYIRSIIKETEKLEIPLSEHHKEIFAEIVARIEKQ